MPSRAPAGAVAPYLRRARLAVFTLFFINAALYANLVPRLPKVKADLGLSNAALGSAIAAMPAGALLAGLLAARIIQRFGSGPVAAYGLVGLAAALAAVPFATTWAALAGLLLVAGALDAVIDVAQNAHGFRVQRGYGRSIVNAFHGVWSIGAVAGGLMGAAAAGLGIPLTAHLLATGAAFALVAIVARGFLLPGPEDAERPPAGDAAGPPLPTRRLRRAPNGVVLTLAALGGLAACGAVVEDAGSSWGALYLRNEVGAGAAVAGLAFVSLQLAMTVGRLTGDRAVNRFGQRRIARLGGVLIAAGMALALAFPSVPTTLAGYLLAGLGTATVVPAAMHAADELPTLRPGVGLTVVSWLLRVGFLVTPWVIGVVADALSLRAALVAVVLAGLGIAVLSRALGPDRTARTAKAMAPGTPAAAPVVTDP